MKSYYDVIVVGGGPAGSWTARYAAEKGVSVLVLEKDREIGTPVRCAEGVSESGLRQYVEIKDSWVSRIIKRMHLIAPDKAVVEVSTGDVGLILHRKLFDYDLAAMASQAGAEIVTKAYVFDLIKRDGLVAGVQVAHMDRIYQISGSVIVGADGVESRVGRWAGFKTQPSHLEVNTCVQMTLTNIDIDPEVVEFYFGREIAPGGYLWVFPKGEKTANVGLGISGVYSKTKKPLAYLNEFVNRKFPNASVLTLVAGCVPTVPTLKEIVKDGLMLVGDAARQVNPLSGGGILSALAAGKIAGNVAADAVCEGNVSARRLFVYQKEWMKAVGKNHERCFKMKKVVDTFSDQDLNNIARMLLSMSSEKRTILQIIKTALIKHPKLILEAVKVFG